MIHIMLSANALKLNIPKPATSPISWNPHQTPISLPRIPSLAVKMWLYLWLSFPSIDLPHFPSIYVSVQSPVLSYHQNWDRRGKYKDQIQQTKTDSDTENHAHPDISGVTLRCGP